MTPPSVGFVPPCTISTPGDQERARAVLEETIDGLAPGNLRAEALSRLAVVRLYGDGFFEGTRLLQHALSEADAESPLRVQILITLAYTLLNANQAQAGMEAVDEAVTRAERLGQPQLLGHGAWHADGVAVPVRARLGRGEPSSRG